MDTICLRSKTLQLLFSGKTGALIQADSLLSGWRIHPRQELGLSWRLLVPAGDQLRNNPVWGEKHPFDEVETGSDFLRMHWNRVVSERAGELNIQVTVTIKAQDEKIIWLTEIDNRSPYVVESVYSPYLGDLTAPADRPELECFYPAYSSARTNRLWPYFDDNCGYWGTDCGTNYIRGVPEAPYVLIHNQEQGLYCGVDEVSCEVVAWNAELLPGFGTGLTYAVPRAQTAAGVPVHLRFAAIHCPYIQPGERRQMTPVFLQAYQGNWERGVDIYKQWIRDKGPRLTPFVPAWVKEPHSWLQYQMNSPEDDLRMTFRELPQLARECRENGIRVIQLVGWNEGGQDRGNPLHRPDPRLGSREELKQAIADCQAEGVRVVLFAKFTWADQTGEWFRDGGSRYAVRNPYGDYYWVDGYYYQTPSQQLGISPRPLIPLCFGSREYRDFCRKEFESMVSLGCDGILYDECQHHGPALLCFDPHHGHRIGAPVYENDNRLIEEFRTVPGMHDDFLFSGEACYDWESAQYALVYHRSQDPDYKPVARYTRPEWPIMTAVTGFNDRNMINQCLMYRFIASYEPYNFKGRPADCGETLVYGKTARAFREKFRNYIWDAEFQGTRGAQVTGPDGSGYHPYAVYRTESGEDAVFVVNYDPQQAVCVSVHCDRHPLTHYRLVEDADWRPLAGQTAIPAESAALFVRLSG